MTIFELQARKHRLEQDILKLVSEAVDDFRKEVGIYPNSIEIDMMSVQRLCESSGKYVVTGCRVELNI